MGRAEEKPSGELNEAEWHQLNNFILLNIKHPDIKDVIEDDYLKKISGISLRMLSVIPLHRIERHTTFESYEKTSRSRFSSETNA